MTDVNESRRSDLTSTRDEFLTGLIANSKVASEILDASGTITWVSENCFDLIGYRAEELLGTHVGDIVHPGDVGPASEIYLDLLERTGAVATLESRARHKDGSWLWIETTISNRIEDPTIGGVVANFRDITDRKLAEMAVRDSERLFRSLARSSPVGIFQHDPTGHCTYVNDRWQEITGISETDAEKGWLHIVHPEDRHRLGISETDAEQFQIPTLSDKAEVRINRPDGSTRWISLRTASLRTDTDDVTGLVGTVEDITDRVDAQRDAQRLLDIFETTTDIVGIGDPDGNLLYLNARAIEFFGPIDAAGPIDLLDMFPEDEVERLADEIIPVLSNRGIWSGEMTLRRRDGVGVPVLAQLLTHVDENGRTEFYSGILHDISERKEFETALAHQANHDPLTGLPNRTLLLTKLTRALDRARKQGSRIAVLFCDLDHFKVVNDSLGHDLGDRLLIAIAERLGIALRPGDTIARFGGDEFVVLCEDLHGRDDAVAIARRVIDSVSGAFEIDDSEIFVGISLGIAFPDDPDADPGTLIRDADAAMYRAKERGRGRWEVFDNAMRVHAVDRLDIENYLRKALERRELRVHYQPLLSLHDGSITGVEALLRWEHPERGLLAPGEFITVAEETGLIVEIGTWVIEQACLQAQRWAASKVTREPLTMSVNLSSRQLGHPALVNEVERVLQDTALAPEHLELEITESVLMDDVEASEETLRSLRALGVRLAVDDFGTGYSSLSYLRRFPVDRLKVDQAFVAGLGQDQSDSAIVHAIVTLAHTLRLDALAEGVETTEQLEVLRELGCDHAQGFLFARPLNSHDIGELLAEHPDGVAR